MPTENLPEPLAVPDLRTLDQNEVDRNLALLIQLVQELNPAVDAKRGVVKDLLFGLSALLATAEQDVADKIIKSNSLLEIQANPALATDAIVDALLSNYRLTRLPATKATGSLTIYLNQPAVIALPAGAVFTYGTNTYVTDNAYTSRTSPADVLTTTDKLVTKVTTGVYAFTVGIVAATAGSAANIKRGTRLTPAINPSPYFSQAVVPADITSGGDAETNAALINRLYTGASTKAWSNRLNIDSLIRSDSRFSRILGVSIIGFGDQEMTRDQHSLWPGSMGGRADVYVRTQAQIASTILTKTATLVSKTDNGGIWQFSLSKAEVPGFYAVDKISQAGAIASAITGYAVQDDVRGYDTTGDDTNIPDIVNATEAAFSAYQTTTIRFLDTDTNTAELAENSSTRSYDVSVQFMPQIADIQNFLKSRQTIGPAGDVLVKAPIPCQVSISFDIELTANIATPNIPAIRNAVAAAVNGLAFGSKLSSSVVAAAVQPLLPVGAVFTNLEMAGQIRHADNTLTNLLASDVLAPTYDSTKPSTSLRTIGYFLLPIDVSVLIVTVDIPQV